MDIWIFIAIAAGLVIVVVAAIATFPVSPIKSRLREPLPKTDEPVIVSGEDLSSPR